MAKSCRKNAQCVFRIKEWKKQNSQKKRMTFLELIPSPGECSFLLTSMAVQNEQIKRI